MYYAVCAMRDGFKIARLAMTSRSRIGVYYGTVVNDSTVAKRWLVSRRSNMPIPLTGEQIGCDGFCMPISEGSGMCGSPFPASAAASPSVLG